MTDITARTPDHDIDPLFLNRWSPRAYTGEDMAEAELFRLFEAARWAPSANNAQPWRFIYARRNVGRWAYLLSLLNEGNRRWADKASALVVLLSKTHQLRAGDTEPAPLRTHSLDAGAAWASLAFQAERGGWRTHAMGGFDRAAASGVLGVPDGYHIEIVIAVGRQGDAAALPTELQAREQPNARRPLTELVAEGRFAFD
jgi:nitroreductase